MVPSVGPKHAHPSLAISATDDLQYIPPQQLVRIITRMPQLQVIIVYMCLKCDYRTLSGHYKSFISSSLSTQIVFGPPDFLFSHFSDNLFYVRKRRLIVPNLADGVKTLTLPKSIQPAQFCCHMVRVCFT